MSWFSCTMNAAFACYSVTVKLQNSNEKWNRRVEKFPHNIFTYKYFASSRRGYPAADSVHPVDAPSSKPLRFQFEIILYHFITSIQILFLWSWALFHPFFPLDSVNAWEMIDSHIYPPTKNPMMWEDFGKVQL